MTLDELAKVTSDSTGYVKSVCKEIIRASFAEIADELEAHGEVRIVNFGKFDVYERQRDKYVHPVSGEIIKAGKRVYPRFKFCDDIIDRVRS